MGTKFERYEALLDEFKDVLLQVGTFCKEKLPDNGGDAMAGDIAIGLMICDRLDKTDTSVACLDDSVERHR